MSLSTRTITSLLNGISRQPAILRSQDQTEDESNTWGSLARGLGRRPPSKHLAKLPITNIESSFVHFINRDKNERYMVVIADGDLRVFDIKTGDEKTVTFPFGKDYLTGASGAFRATTVADYTFVVNSSVKPAMAAVGADETPPPAGYYQPGGYLATGSAVSV